MTVSELIEYLNEFDGDKNIWIEKEFTYAEADISLKQEKPFLTKRDEVVFINIENLND